MGRISWKNSTNVRNEIKIDTKCTPTILNLLKCNKIFSFLTYSNVYWNGRYFLSNSRLIPEMIIGIFEVQIY